MTEKQYEQYREIKKEIDNLKTFKKFTDEEIIETLERCSKCDGCFGCAMAYMQSAKCITVLQTECLDLINRQKAEIKRLKGSTVVNNIMESQRIKREAKAEAYKEFAERLENICKGIITQEWNKKAAPISWSCAYADFIDDIDNLLKEMVGEEE